MCHILDPRSYLGGDGHSAHILKTVSGSYIVSYHCQIGSWSIHDYDIPPRSQFTYGNIFSIPFPFMGPLDRTLHTIVVHDPGVVFAPIRTCLVLLILHVNSSHTVQISRWSITLCNQICKFSAHPCKMMGRCMQVISNRVGSLLRGSILSKRLYVF